jgi:zinc protease
LSLAIRVRDVPGLPVVSLRVLLEGGARRESLPGQAYVTGRMLSEGSRRRDWRRIAEDLEAKGMILGTAASFEVTALSIDALSADWEEALEWAAELVLEPAFPEDRCAWVRRQVAAELESMGDQPEVRTAWAFMEQLYAPHPRARRLQGDEASLLALAPVDCAAFHRRSLERRRIVTVAGEVDEEAVRRRVEALFGTAPAGPSEEEELPAPGDNEPRRRVELPGTEQAHLYLGHRTVTRSHPDLAALELVGVILGAGAGITGRIPQRIREREGLAYSTYVQTVAGAGIDPGRLVAYVGTSPTTVEQAERGVVEELARLCQEGVEEKELAEARAYLLGREPFRRETARQWADLLAEAEFYGIPSDDPAWREESLRAPDRAAIEAAARKHLKPEAVRVTLGLPAQG